MDQWGSLVGVVVVALVLRRHGSVDKTRRNAEVIVGIDIAWQKHNGQELLRDVCDLPKT
jgi:hypothetical protein